MEYPGLVQVTRPTWHGLKTRGRILRPLRQPRYLQGVGPPSVARAHAIASPHRTTPVGSFGMNTLYRVRPHLGLRAGLAGAQVSGRRAAGQRAPSLHEVPACTGPASAVTTNVDRVMRRVVCPSGGGVRCGSGRVLDAGRPGRRDGGHECCASGGRPAVGAPAPHGWDALMRPS